MGNHYYATLGHTNADVVPLVQQFDNRLRRDQWVQHSRLAGSDIEVRPVTARQADSLTRRLVHRLDRYLLQAPEYEPLSDMKDDLLYYNLLSHCNILFHLFECIFLYVMFLFLLS